MHVRAAVLRACGLEPSQLACQYAVDAPWASGGTILIAADSASFRALVNFFRIRCLPAELCPEDTTPESLASRLVTAIPAADRAIFAVTVRYYFPGEAATYVLPSSS